MADGGINYSRTDSRYILNMSHILNASRSSKTKSSPRDNRISHQKLSVASFRKRVKYFRCSKQHSHNLINFTTLCCERSHSAVAAWRAKMIFNIRIRRQTLSVLALVFRDRMVRQSCACSRCHLNSMVRYVCKENLQ